MVEIGSGSSAMHLSSAQRRFALASEGVLKARKSFEDLEKATEEAGQVCKQMRKRKNEAFYGSGKTDFAYINSAAESSYLIVLSAKHRLMVDRSEATVSMMRAQKEKLAAYEALRHAHRKHDSAIREQRKKERRVRVRAWLKSILPR